MSRVKCQMLRQCPNMFSLVRLSPPSNQAARTSATKYPGSNGRNPRRVVSGAFWAMRPAVPNPTEVYECGGWQEIYRKIVVDPPDECGLRCPALQRTKKCNQKKCPVDCVMSE